MLFRRDTLYSNSLSAIPKIPCSILLELLRACFCFNSKFGLSQSSLRMDDKSLVFNPIGFQKDLFSRNGEAPEAETFVLQNLNNLMEVLSLILLLPRALSSKYIIFANSNTSFLSSKL